MTVNTPGSYLMARVDAVPSRNAQNVGVAMFIVLEKFNDGAVVADMGGGTSSEGNKIDSANFYSLSWC
jgi:hypothetical protein